MNTETKASHDALVVSQHAKAAQPTSSSDRSKDQLLADLKAVVADAERIIKETAEDSAKGVKSLHALAESKLLEAKAKLEQVRGVVSEKARYATDATRVYVEDNPWKTAGIAAGVGVLVGFLLARR